MMRDRLHMLISIPVKYAVSQVNSKFSNGIFATAILLLVTSFSIDFPGKNSVDSAWQYEQAVSGRFNDQHPPIMAFVWSLLRHLVDGPQTMLAFHLTSHWLGFALLADGLYRAGRRKASWLTLASGASPLFIYYNWLIYKDVGLASALVAGFGLVFWYRIQGRTPPPIIIIIALLFLLYGTLVRFNAVFAFAPLLLYASVDISRLSAVRSMVLLCILPVIAIPLSTKINHALLKAKASGVMQSLQLYDIVGIAHQTGDLSVLPPTVHLTSSELDRCYTPLYWDTLAMEICKNAWEGLPPVGSPARDDIGRMWIDAIIFHPVGYAQHRLKQFNADINFFVPALQCRFSPFDGECGDHDPESGKMVMNSNGLKLIRWDYVKKNPLVWPVNWIVLGLCVLALSWRLPRSETILASNVLLLSGLGYSLAYTIVGVAANIRYFYWPIMAIQTSIVIVGPLLAPRVRKMELAVVICLSLLILTVSAGYLARLTDNETLVPHDPET